MQYKCRILARTCRCCPCFYFYGGREDLTENIVLLVSATEALASMTGRLLERKGYHVSKAVGIRQAEAAVREKMPQLVIMDCSLPDGDGITLCQNWRLQHCTFKIVLTSNNELDEVAALHAGADDFIKKPYRLEVLLARMKRLCESS